MSDNPRRPHLKTKRGLLGAVLVIGLVALIGYLLIAKGPSLGQKQIDARNAKQHHKQLVKAYRQTVADPHQNSEARMQKAQQALTNQKLAKQQAASARAAKLAAHAPPPLPPMPATSALSPPPGMDISPGRVAAMQRAHRAAYTGHADNAGGGGVATSVPRFVMYQAPSGSGLLHHKHGVFAGHATPQPAPAGPASARGLALEQQQARNLQTLAKQRLAHERAQANHHAATNSEGDQKWLFHQQNASTGTSQPTVATTNRALYWIAPGTIIHAVALNAINTMLPGHVRARVTQTVYDSRYGRYVVIPKGSVLNGSYNSNVADGQKRVQVAFKSLVTPSGGIVPIKGLVGGDRLGRSGVPGTLHTHFWERMGVATLMGIEAAGMDRLSNRHQVFITGQDAGQQGVTDGGRIIANAAKREIKERFATGPNITVPAGALLTISTDNGIEVPPIANAR